MRWDNAYFAVAANEELALAGIDTVAGERVDFDLLHSQKNGQKRRKRIIVQTHHL